MKSGVSGSQVAVDQFTDDDFIAIPAEEKSSDLVAEVPKVSVLMLAWQHAEFIDEAIQSVINQRCDMPFELIIGEDHSADATLACCLDWQKRYPTIIRVITSRGNVGMHRNFARIWQRARGEYIAVCEGDDYWTDDRKLQKQLDWFEKHPGANLLGTWTERILRNKAGTWEVQGRSVPLETKQTYYQADLLRDYAFHFSSVMLRKAAVRFPRWFWEVYCVDRPLYLLAVEQGTAGLLPEVTSRYRQHPGGMWSPRSALSKAAASMDLFRRFEEHLPKNYVEICRQTLAGILWSYMSEAISAGDLATARKLYWQALRENPRHILHGRVRIALAAGLRVHSPAIYRLLGGKGTVGTTA